MLNRTKNTYIICGHPWQDQYTPLAKLVEWEERRLGGKHISGFSSGDPPTRCFFEEIQRQTKLYSYNRNKKLDRYLEITVEQAAEHVNIVILSSCYILACISITIQWLAYPQRCRSLQHAQLSPLHNTLPPNQQSNNQYQLTIFLCIWNIWAWYLSMLKFLFSTSIYSLEEFYVMDTTSLPFQLKNFNIVHNIKWRMLTIRRY